MDENIKRSFIIDNYKHPFNKEKLEGTSIRAKSATCIDDISLKIKLDGGIIRNAYFDGEACVISTAATSIILKNIIGKTVEEALKFLENYEAMINEEDYDTALLNDLIVFDNIYKQPNRKQCALISAGAIIKYLKENYGRQD